MKDVKLHLQPSPGSTSATPHPSASHPNECAPGIQIVIGINPNLPDTSQHIMLFDRLLTTSFLWSLIGMVFVIGWRKKIARLLTAVITRIESGDQIEMPGVKLTHREPEPGEPLIYTVTLDEKGTIKDISGE